jgi:riboflavin synthase
MAYEIINARRGTSIIRAEAPGTYTVQLSDLSTNTSIETVTDASIKRVNWSSNGHINIARGSTPNTVISLYSSGEMRLDDYGYSLANGSTGNIVVTIVTGGSVVMEVSKTATYSTDLDKL